MILEGDVSGQLATLGVKSVQCCVTSPPYWGLRNYGVPGQIGLEKTPEEYVDKMVEVCRGIWRVLRDDGTFWLNIGDSYASVKPKDLCLIPFRLALALQADGWYVRSDIAWCKKSSMPESVTDRPTSAWEHLFLLTKSERYYYDSEAVKEKSKFPDGPNGRIKSPHGQGFARGMSDGSSTSANLRNYWLLGPEPFPDAHFATFPSEIPRRCIRAGTSEKGCCEKCGSPWERVVEKGQGEAYQQPVRMTGRPDGAERQYIGGGQKEWNSYQPPQTIGWQPTCSCNAEVIPCTVLDPFLGSGTTAMVAQALDRRWIGIELNSDYIEIAERRIQQTGYSQINMGI